MTDKTLGQVAFEAWLPAWLYPVVKWEEIPEAHRHQWEAAAEAVSETVIQKWSTTLWPLRDAVIEAARRVVKRRRAFDYASVTDDDALALRYAERHLREAIEALEAAEKDDE